MQTLTSDRFDQLIKDPSVSPRLRRELRFVPSVGTLTDQDYLEREMVAVHDRSGQTGVLIIETDATHVIPYALTRGIKDSQTGRGKPVICDFCKTWQSGSHAGRITFRPDRRLENSFSYLVCADLDCSAHVRSKTAASARSRTQLHEDIDDARRIERLQESLRALVARFQTGK